MSLGRWHERSRAARFDLSARLQLYALFAVGPVLVGARLGPTVGQAAMVIAGLTAVHALICVLLLRTGLDHYLGKVPRPDRLIALTVGLTVTGVVAASFLHPWRMPGQTEPVSIVVLVLGISALAALSVTVPPQVIVAAMLLSGVTVYTLSSAEDASARGASIRFLLIAAAAAFASRATAWTLDLVWQIDASRHVQARLAVAQERLRFARDLHDVLGQALSVIALKAELAAQLAKRDRGEAIDEMLEVRRIAQDSLAEVRAVVRGFRTADLDVELAGARSLLLSAGIDCRVSGDGLRLPDQVQGTLGWVVHEATTNVLRHSEARSTDLTLRWRPDGMVTLMMENDGVSEAELDERVRFGSGLVGLAERVAGLGGSVVASRRPPDRFCLTVELPATEQTPVEQATVTSQEEPR